MNDQLPAIYRGIFLFTKDREEWLSEVGNSFEETNPNISFLCTKVFLAPQTGGELQHIATLPLFWVIGNHHDYDDSGDDDYDDGDDIYIMVKCVSVCVSAKVIFSEVNGA